MSRLQRLGTVEEVILYRQDRPFTKTEIRNWEEHYHAQLRSKPIFNEFFRKKEWILVEKSKIKKMV